MLLMSIFPISSFLIYINDLSKIIQSSQIRMFADDTCLFVTNKDHKLAQVTLNRDLDLISNWAPPVAGYF